MFDFVLAALLREIFGNGPDDPAPAPASLGTSFDTISRSLARCSLFSILRETPTLEANGM